MTQANHFSQESNIEKARKALQERGVYFVENAYDDAYCRRAREFMDAHQDSPSVTDNRFRMEMNYAGSELRIWDAQKKNDELQHFLHECDVTMSALIQQKTEAYTLLAIRNQQIDNQNDLVTLGRWHIDSIFKQLKIFLFLTDTSEESGPFEFIPKTHHNTFKLKVACSGRYLKPTDFLKKGKRAYQRLDDAWVHSLNQKGYVPQAAICKAGTIMVVNTSAIHRARPCIQGSRYALTAYYR